MCVTTFSNVAAAGAGGEATSELRETPLGGETAGGAEARGAAAASGASGSTDARAAARAEHERAQRPGDHHG